MCVQTMQTMQTIMDMDMDMDMDTEVSCADLSTGTGTLKMRIDITITNVEYLVLTTLNQYCTYSCTGMVLKEDPSCRWAHGRT